MRYGGTFDWLAIGDDDTVFMYNRAKAFLKHIDHTQVRGFHASDLDMLDRIRSRSSIYPTLPL